MTALAAVWMVFTGSAQASPAACAPCHRQETSGFAGAAMTRALAVPNADLQLATRIGPYSYAIERGTLAVTDGRETLRVPIEWAFGKGTVGQTFLFRRDGRWYESRVSYYSALRGLDITMGQQSFTPRNLEEAAGRLMPPVEVGKCFDCHATNVSKSDLSAMDLSAMVGGVQCERCHGPSEAHVRAMGAAPMKRLATLDAEEMSEFCGQCHRTWSQVASAGPRGIQNIRFQPYRLANSKCYDAADRRIRCTACHNPHRDLETSAAAYDAKCAACHGSKARAVTCKVSTKNCVTCHMPKLELPGSHRKFTDHRIRIARASEPYPD